MAPMHCWTCVIVVYGYSVLALGEEPQHLGPRFLTEPQGKVEFSNSSGTVIPCSAEGSPHPIVSWFKHDGEALQDLPGLRHVRHDGTLVFPPFPAEEYRADVHAAVYRCEASNSVGTIGSREVDVRAIVTQEYSIQLFDEFVLRGNMAVLHCPVPSFASDYVRVTSWERIDGFLITASIISGKYGMLDNGDLYIRDTTEHDTTYSFRCHVENTVTRDKKVSRNYSRVIVTDPHYSQPPRITRRPNRVTVTSGQRATLACIAQGYPIPIYRWRKMFGDEITLAGLGSSVRQEGGILIFEKVSHVNNGKYSCYVSNSVGEDKMDIDLVVEEELRAAIFPKVQRIDIGKNATFNCTISGGPFGAVVWKKDMRYLTSNPRATYPAPTMLQIARANRQDAGMYQCFAQRDTVTVQSSARLVIGDLAPKFKTTFPEKIVRSGSYVSLSCIATGNPAPQVRWTIDGIWPLSTRPGISVNTFLSNHGDVFSYVNITSVDVSDSGAYVCEAINDAGRTVHTRRLNVFGNIFIRSLNNVSALAGSGFTVMCPFGGYPFDTIVWKREGRPLPVNQRQRVFPNGTLHIMDMQPGVDDGLYSCEVSYGQQMPVSRTFSIFIRTKPQVANFAFRDNLHEGKRTAVTCIVLAGDPPITTRWMKDNLPLMEEDLDASIVYAGNGYVSTLTIDTLAYKHNGNYTCLATNDVGNGAFSSRLVVKVPPRWLLEPKDTSAIAGRSARIDCQADGVPQPHVRWKMSATDPPEEFKTIVSSSHVHILVNGSLNFRSAETSDEGSYLCEANNGVGAGLSTVVRLMVHSAPKFDSKFMVLSARRGEKTLLECTSYGDLPMTFSWRKNGVILDPIIEPRYSQDTADLRGGSAAKLIIEKAEREDSASFTCTSTNDFGEDSMNFQLTVQDVPDAPQSLEVHDVSSRSVRLTWNKPFDGNSPILRYSAAWRQIDGPTGGPINVPGSETTVTIRGLKPKTRHFFRVKCENVLGDSQFGAEVAVTTLDEPPRSAPLAVKAVPLSSRSVNISWQKSHENDDISSVDGFYVGYKKKGGPDPFTFKSVPMTADLLQHLELGSLNRFTEYSLVVQPFNSRGAGPPSEEIEVRTMEFDRPGTPAIKSYYTTSKSIKLLWELDVASDAPVSGYNLYQRMEGSLWQEAHLRGEHNEYIFHDLQCGTKYYCYLVAFNTAGHGNSSEIISVKTDGNAPIAPDKRLLLTLNSTTLCVNLNSWHNGGCPIRFFIIQYKASGHSDWTLVSNNIIPEQQNITISDLIPGTWYSLLMTARNDAGSTDAEYVFATLTLSGEYPPRPSEVSDVSGSFYRHLLITVPVVSSAIVLFVVLCVVCLITRRRSSGRRTLTSEVGDINEPTKPETMPLSSTYETGQEPAYFPAPYAASRVPGFNRETCIHPGNQQQNMGTFGSSRGGYTYDIPYPPRKMDKSGGNYESPILYFPSYHSKELDNLQEHTNYKISNRKHSRSRSWKTIEEDNSSADSEDGQIVLSSDDRVLKEESRESETECDRIWKSFEECKYEANRRWAEHTVSILT